MIKNKQLLLLFFSPLFIPTCWQACKCGSLLYFRPAAAGVRWFGKNVAQQEGERVVGIHLWCKEKKNPIKSKSNYL